MEGGRFAAGPPQTFFSVCITDRKTEKVLHLTVQVQPGRFDLSTGIYFERLLKAAET